MPKGFSTISTLNPEQQQGFSQLINLLQSLTADSGSYLQQLLSGSPEAFSRFEAPYMRQFQEQTIPGLAERFAGLGGLSSSGFQQALGQAGAGLSENLASMREGMRSQVPGQILSNLQNLLQTQTQAYLPKPMGFGKQLGLGLAGGISGGLGSALGLGLGSLFGR